MDFSLNEFLRELWLARQAIAHGLWITVVSALLSILAGSLLGARKAYLAECRLGVTTDTADSEGEVIRQRPVPQLDAAAIETAASRRGNTLRASQRARFARGSRHARTSAKSPAL